MHPDEVLKTHTPPFDAVAAGYDAQFTETAVGRLQRSVVWTFLETWKNAQREQTLRVLELNCGTGEDARWLARQGFRVLASDISPAMTAITEIKARQAGLAECIETQVIDIQTLELNDKHLFPNSFDLIFSNFGGLNCIPPESLQRLGAVVPGLLKPDGHFVAVVMGRFCVWETVYFLLKGRFRSAFRRFSRQAVAAHLSDQTMVETWYYAPKELNALLRTGGFSRRIVTMVQPIGFWLPPSYLNPFFEKRTRFLRFLHQLEKKCRRPIWAWGADHFLICIKNPDLSV